MGIPEEIEDAVDEAKICLDRKGIGWLLNDLNIHEATANSEVGGKYVYTPDKNTTDIYLEPESDELAVTTVLLHECGHRLFTEEFTPAERKEVKAYYKKLHAKYSLPTIPKMIEELQGEKIENFGRVETVVRPKKGAQVWVFELDSGDEVEVDGLESLKFFYYKHAPSITENQLKAFPTSYSYNNDIEWFAEIFAFWCEDDVSPSLDKFLGKLIKPYARKAI